MAPFLVFRRTGRAIGAVVAFGFGGGTVLMGVATSLGSALRLGAFFPALSGYLLASSPLFLLGWLLSRCRRELWFLPEAEAFRMLTYRPWLVRGPRVEQAPLDDYRAVTTRMISPVAEEDSTVVALVTQDGDAVPVREFRQAVEAGTFLERLAGVTGLPTEIVAPDDDPAAPSEAS